MQTLNTFHWKVKRQRHSEHVVCTEPQFLENVCIQLERDTENVKRPQPLTNCVSD